MKFSESYVVWSENEKKKFFTPLRRMLPKKKDTHSLSCFPSGIHYTTCIMVNFLWKTFPTKALSMCACVGERRGEKKSEGKLLLHDVAIIEKCQKEKGEGLFTQSNLKTKPILTREHIQSRTFLAD